MRNKVTQKGREILPAVPPFLTCVLQIRFADSNDISYPMVTGGCPGFHSCRNLLAVMAARAQPLLRTTAAETRTEGFVYLKDTHFFGKCQKMGVTAFLGYNITYLKRNI